jgi:hypothetical protein
MGEREAQMLLDHAAADVHPLRDRCLIEILETAHQERLAGAGPQGIGKRANAGDLVAGQCLRFGRGGAVRNLLQPVAAVDQQLRGAALPGAAVDDDAAHDVEQIGGGIEDMPAAQARQRTHPRLLDDFGRLFARREPANEAAQTAIKFSKVTHDDMLVTLLRVMRNQEASEMVMNRTVGAELMRVARPRAGAGRTRKDIR